MRLSILTRVKRIFRALSERLPRALAIGLGLAPAEPEYAGRLRAAQIAAIVRLTPMTIGASCLNAAILLATLGSVGELRPTLWVWTLLLFALAVHYARNWLTGRQRDPNRPATRAAIRKVILHAGLFGALWAAVPVLTFADAPPLVQLLIGCLTAGMMCAGGFVLATVPLAGVSYVLLVAAGAFFVLLQDGSPIYLGLTALLTVYAGVVIVNLNWNAFLFVSHFLAEAQVQKEVAAREQVQAQAAHTERMTALGELAGGIAHDFNNILQALAGNAALIEKHPENIQEVRRQAGAMLDAAERGGSISRRLLAFARRDVLTKEPVDAVGMLSGLHELLQRMLGSGITVRVEADPQLGALLADKPQLETVLLNLAANARDAMPNGGELTLLAASEAIDQDRENPRLKAGRYISISVADSGIGMDAATLTRATEPFFTTKPKGKGTGLGLSMAKGFAEQSGGAFAISSEPGRGTIARIWLPQADAAITGSPAQPVPCLADGSAVDRKRHVLVVDDDELVRQVLMLSLEGAGFAIAGAPDGSHALAYLDRGEKVDALVTDFAMPGMNGVDLIAAARNRTPSLPAVLLTGHVGDIALPAFDGASKNRFILIQKPVRAAELAERLARAIDEAGS